MAKKNKKNVRVDKIETSKIIAFMSGISFIVALFYSMLVFGCAVATDKSCDYAFLITLISVTGAAWAVATTTYYNKSRHENAYKLQWVTLKMKYLLLKDIELLDSYRVQQELENELSSIKSSLDNEKTMSNQEITYNG